MKRYVGILIFWAVHTGWSQALEVEIDTGRPFMSKKWIRMSTHPEELSLFETSLHLDQFKWGVVKASFLDSDSMVIQINNHLPILVTGLLDADTARLIISQLPYTRHPPAD